MLANLLQVWPYYSPDEVPTGLRHVWAQSTPGKADTALRGQILTARCSWRGRSSTASAKKGHGRSPHCPSNLRARPDTPVKLGPCLRVTHVPNKIKGNPRRALQVGQTLQVTSRGPQGCPSKNGRGGKSPNPEWRRGWQACGRTADGRARSRGVSLPPRSALNRNTL